MTSSSRWGRASAHADPGAAPVVHRVTAIEVDPRLAGALEDTVRALQPQNADKLRLVAGDA